MAEQATSLLLLLCFAALPLPRLLHLGCFHPSTAPCSPGQTELARVFLSALRAGQEQALKGAHN